MECQFPNFKNGRIVKVGNECSCGMYKLRGVGLFVFFVSYANPSAKYMPSTAI